MWTLDAQRPKQPSSQEQKKHKINQKKAFPYLDMELYWKEDQVKLQVHLKEN